MEKHKYTSGSSFESTAAYSRAVKVGNTIYVSGTTGYDYTTMTISEDIVIQTDQCFQNIMKALNHFGASLSDIIKVSYILPEADQFEACWPTIRKYLGSVKPAATMISAGLANTDMKIEIEVIAITE